jgi:hypothetical protein
MDVLIKTLSNSRIFIHLRLVTASSSLASSSVGLPQEDRLQVDADAEQSVGLATQVATSVVAQKILILPLLNQSAILPLLL